MWNGEKDVGVTVHWVSSKLGEGDIILQRTVPIEKFSSLYALQNKLDYLGADLISEVVPLIKQNSAIRIKQDIANGKTYTKPTLTQERIQSSRLGARSQKEDLFISP